MYHISWNFLLLLSGNWKKGRRTLSCWVFGLEYSLPPGGGRVSRRPPPEVSLLVTLRANWALINVCTLYNLHPVFRTKFFWHSLWPGGRGGPAKIYSAAKTTTPCGPKETELKWFVRSFFYSALNAMKWPNLVSKRPVKVRRWQIYHYYGFDCTELHMLSIDSIAASLFENIWLPHSSQYQRKCVGASTYIKGENYWH